MKDVLKRLAVARDRQAISEISYQFCTFLKRLEPECPGEVLLAGCLASEKKQEGDVCVELDREAGRLHYGEDRGRGIRAPGLEEWVDRCEQSFCVGRPGEHRPLVLDENGRLYLHKYWMYERELARRLIDRASREEKWLPPDRIPEKLNIYFEESDGEVDWQQAAVFAALTQNVTVISGGPGTGKTTTVAKILMLLAESDRYRHIALAAPTGKAAARLKESVSETVDAFSPDSRVRERIPEEAFTLHKLLGARRYSAEYRYGKDNPLPYDAVVVDEVSMVDLAMMHRLSEALRGKAKLILLGDKDQLASVEAGAVLGSVCVHNINRFSPVFIRKASDAGLKIPDRYSESEPKPLTDNIILLEKNYRFGPDSGIGTLASAILAGDTEKARQVLDGDTHTDAQHRSFDDLTGFKDILTDFLEDYFSKLGDGKATAVDKAMGLISRLGLLCVHRRGPLGSGQVNRLTEKILREKRRIPVHSEWYTGKPVIVTRNDYSLGLRNGDLGVTLRNREGELKVYFRKDGDRYHSYFPSRLSNIETAYAITVHKSQGSEFEDVAVVLPGRVSPVSTRELLYTAVTRARNSCTIVGSTDVFEQSLSQKASRSSGLRDYLWETEPQ